MKKYLVGIAIGILLSAIALVYYQVKVVSPQLKAAKEAYDKVKSDADAYRKEREKKEADDVAIIQAQGKKIADLLANAGTPTPLEQEKDKTIAELKKKLSDYEAAGDFRLALAAAKQTISELEQKCTLAEMRHKIDMQDLNIAWQTKYDATKDIADLRLVEIAKRGEQIKACEKRASIAESKIKFTGLWSKLSTAGLILLGAYAVLK